MILIKVQFLKLLTYLFFSMTPMKISMPEHRATVQTKNQHKKIHKVVRKLNNTLLANIITVTLDHRRETTLLSIDINGNQNKLFV